MDDHGEDVLVEMFEQWHFFRVLLTDIATALAKADLDIASQYSRLAGERHETFFPAIRTEYRNCVDMILKLWTSDPPFDIKGKYWSIKMEKNIVLSSGVGYLTRPLQQPHPPIGTSAVSPFFTASSRLRFQLVEWANIR